MIDVGKCTDAKLFGKGKPRYSNKPAAMRDYLRAISIFLPHERDVLQEIEATKTAAINSLYQDSYKFAAILTKELDYMVSGLDPVFRAKELEDEARFHEAITKLLYKVW